METTSLAKPKLRRLYFRLIKDPSLDLASRIIYSYLWKWAFINYKSVKNPKYSYKPVTIRRVRRATGFRDTTIKSKLSILTSKGYLDSKMEPYKKHENLFRCVDGNCSFRKIEWTERGSLKAIVAKAFVAGTKKKCTNRYFAICLGINRRTVSRIRQNGGNGCPIGGNGCPIEVATDVPLGGNGCPIEVATDVVQSRAREVNQQKVNLMENTNINTPVLKDISLSNTKPENTEPDELDEAIANILHDLYD